MLTPIQCRMARAALGLGVRELGELAGVAAMTVTRFENERSSGAEDSQKKMRRALEKAGVEFIEENGGREGVRLGTRARSSLQRGQTKRKV